jgi:lysophospholipase L1-like esterase
MNCGVIGYNLEQEIEFIKERVIPYHPDIIVLSIGPNDIDRRIVFSKNRISNALFDDSYICRQIFFLINELRKREDEAGTKFQVRMDSAIRSFKELRSFLAKGQRVVLVVKDFTPWMGPIVRIAKDRGYFVLDFSKDWKASGDGITIARQDRHFNALGARLMAKRIYDLLMREVVKDNDRNISS